MKVLQRDAGRNYHIATFKKVMKPKSVQVKASIGPALLDQCLMPVELTRINEKCQLKIRFGRGKAYTDGNKIGRGKIYSSPAEPRRYLPSLVDAGLLQIRTCEGDLHSVNQVAVDQCRSEPF